MQKIIVEEKERLDLLLLKNIPSHTRSYIKNMIIDGKVMVNGKTETKAGFEVKANDVVEFELLDPIPLEAKAEDIPLDIVYEDNDLLVINKPQGMVVHPAIKNYEGTLVNALLYQVKDLSGINGVMRPGIVHRLDKDTSGLLLVAKNDFAHNSLSKQIQEKTCKRYYIALVQNRMKEDSGEIKTNIGRDPKNRLKMAVVKEGKVADTFFKVLKNYVGYSLVEFELKTGRTHQIRVHSAYINHPIVGDKLYNPNKCKFDVVGQMLHAYKIKFNQPSSGKLLEFEVPLPEYFNKILERLKEE